MSVLGSGTLSVRKKDVKESKSIAIGFKNLTFATKATGGETGINLASLSLPSEMSSQGFTNPNTQELQAANLLFYRKNFTLVSSLRGVLMDYLSYTLANSSQINFNGFTALPGEIFTGIIDSKPTTDVKMVDAAPLNSTGTLAVGVTDYNVGQPFEVGKYPNTQVGAVLVFRNGILQFRNPGNGTSGGNYREVPAGAGLAVIIRFNNAPVGIEDNILVISNGLLAYRPDGSLMAEIENVKGQIDSIIPTVAALSGQPTTNFQIAPNSVDLKAFGDLVLTLLNAEVPIETAWTSFTPVFDNAPTNVVLTPWITRRKGENIEIEGGFNATGTGGGGPFALHPPFDVFPGITLIDTQVAGTSLSYAIGGDAGYDNVSAYVSINKVFLVDNATGSGLAGSVINASDWVTFKVSIRVAGWAKSQTIRQQLGL